jgi:signal transduction histidine kinase/DNA-binding response OmpR family regulator
MQSNEKSRILVIDDISENRIFLQIFLEINFEVNTANSGENGLIMAIEKIPDLILLDIMMPGLSGYETCTCLKNEPRTKHIPVIFISALNESFDKVTAFKCGGIDYITKPFQKDELFARINTHLSIAQLQRKLEETNKILEQKVQERTFELQEANEKLKIEIAKKELATNEAILAKEQWENTFDSVPDLIFIADTNFKILNANKAMIQRLKKPLNEINGTFCYSTIHKICCPESFCPHHFLLKDQKAHQVETFDKNLNGHFIITDSPLFDKNGNLYGSVHVAHEITERVNAEKAVKKSEQNLKNIIDSAPFPILVIRTSDSKIIKLNQATIELYKVPNFMLNELTTDMAYQNLEDKYKLREILLQQGFIENYQLTIKTFDGELLTINNWVTKIKFHDEDCLLITQHDVTEQKETEEKILNAIIHAEEKERERFAQELHDGLGPYMSMIKLYFQWIAKPDRKANIDDLFLKAEETIDEASKCIKEISNRLSPHLLQNVGLISAVKSFINKMKDLNPIEFSFFSNLEKRQSPNQETILYRIITESINNAVKHANAKKIELFIEEIENRVLILISDDGIGFDADQVTEKPIGFGLLNMKNRLNSIHGDLKIISNKNLGTKIFITI